MIWVPDLYIRQLREMRVLTLFEEISSLRLYPNSTISLSIGATIIIKCDMDFVLYPLDVQKCAVDFSSCKWEGQITYFSTLTALLFFALQTSTRRKTCRSSGGTLHR